MPVAPYACNGAAAFADVSRRRTRRAAGSGPIPAVAAARATRRIVAVDNLRGLAIVAMVTYHFCFDLVYFRLTKWDFYHDPFWLHARTIILSSFLLIAGVSLVLADRDRRALSHYWRHIAIIGACALVVSAGSYALFPASWIWFGVLHAIAVSLVLARPLVRRPLLALVIGACVIAAGNLFMHPAFDHHMLGWIGFMTAKPRTEDYVPLFPWTGVMLVGVAAGHALLRAQFRPITFATSWPRWLAWLGRHSLAIYMVHQPLLIGFLYLIAGR
jgi:uncharacterized membrane protein